MKRITPEESIASLKSDLENGRLTPEHIRALEKLMSERRQDLSHLFTSESVTEGHPDKMADQISDAILDAILKQDPNARVACETLLSNHRVTLAGEITTTASVDYEKIVRQTIREIGYDSASLGFDPESYPVQIDINTQSPDIAMGVDTGGAGDQGMMFGYASNETENLMPLSVTLSQGLTKKLAEVRKNGELSYLRPDGKAQVTIEYDGAGKPKRINTVVLSTQHSPDVEQSVIRQDVIEHVIKPVCGEWLDENTIYHINPTGKFVIGGPGGDSGLTGRKIIVDTYGGKAHHGGGAFSGKDATKVDRSAAYMGRYIAKNIVAAGLAEQCEVQIAYAIGVADPVSVMVDTFGTGKVSDEKLIEAIKKVFPLTPKGIIAHLDLKKPVFQKTASNGHFGRPEFSWEKTDKISELRRFK